jgi:hypothetical protein
MFWIYDVADLRFFYTIELLCMSYYGEPVKRTGFSGLADGTTCFARIRSGPGCMARK